MNLREEFRFEFVYQLRQISTWLLFTVLLVFAVYMIRGVSIPDWHNNGMLITAPIVILGITVFGSAIWLLISGVIAGEAASRDVQTRMYPLTYTSPVSKMDYLGGRFLAAFALNAFILLAIPLGILLGTYLPGVDPIVKGSFRPAAYLNAYGFFALPNAFVITAIQFFWASLTKRGVTAYLSSWALLFISHIGVGGLGELLDQKNFSPRLDLVGIIGTWAHLERTWTAIEKSTRLLLPEGDFLINRLVWLSIALVALSYTYFRFRFTNAAEGSRRESKRRKKANDPIPAFKSEINSNVVTPQVQRTFGFATYATQTITIAFDSFRSILKIRSGSIFLIIFGMPVFIYLSGPLTNDIPATGHVIRLLAPSLSVIRSPLILIPFLIIYYAGELVWREREAGISEINDTFPVSEWAWFTGKFLGLGLVIMVWLTILIGDGILAQLDKGYHTHEIGLYIQALFGIQLTNYLLFALLVLVVHVVAGQKYLGHMLAVAVFAFIAGAPAFGIHNHLLVYSTDPGWAYTETDGFGYTLTQWLLFKAYWVGWAILLAVAAKLLWTRGRNINFGIRLTLVQNRFTRATALTALTGLIVVLSTGVFILNNTETVKKVKLDQLFDRIAEKNKGMGSIIISKDGKVFYTRSFGYSQVTETMKKSITADTKFRIASITKTYTAVMIFQLIEEGKLQLTDHLDNFFPQIPNASKITIAQILNHRSGIPEIVADQGWRQQSRTHEEVLSAIAKGEPNFEPDSKHLYSNSGYVLLGYIVEKVGGKPYQEALKQRITSKIGLKDTYLGIGNTDVSKNESLSYMYLGAWKEAPEMNFSVPAGAGAIISTPTDMAKFIQALFDLKLVSKSSLDQMKTMRDGEGMGMEQFSFAGKTLYGHTGGSNVSGSWLAYEPTEKVAMAYTTNAKIFPVAQIIAGVFDIYWNRPFEIPAFEELQVNPEILDKYVGVYAIAGTPSKMIITRRGSTVFIGDGTDPIPLEAIATDKFKMGRQVTFEFNAAKKQMTIKRPQGESVFTKEN